MEFLAPSRSSEWQETPEDSSNVSLRTMGSPILRLSENSEKGTFCYTAKILLLHLSEENSHRFLFAWIISSLERGRMPPSIIDRDVVSPMLSLLACTTPPRDGLRSIACCRTSGATT